MKFMSRRSGMGRLESEGKNWAAYNEGWGAQNRAGRLDLDLKSQEV